MKGYYTDYSYVGWIPNGKGGGRWKFFSSDTEYREAYNEAVIENWKQRMAS